MRALPGGLFESNHDIGLREDKRGGGRGGDLPQHVIHQAPAYFTLIVKVVERRRRDGHYNFVPNGNVSLCSVDGV